MKRLVTALLTATLVASACGSSTPIVAPASSTTVPAPVTPGPSELPTLLPGVTTTPDATEAPLPSVTPVPNVTPAPTIAPTPSPTDAPGEVPGGLQVLKAGQRDMSPDVPAADLRRLVRGNTAFAIDLYSRLRKASNGNIVFGPYSISSAFGMLNPGAVGTTAQQIEDVLHFTLPTDRLDPAFNALSLQLASRENHRLEISIANRLFGQQGYPFQQPYLRSSPPSSARR